MAPRRREATSRKVELLEKNVVIKRVGKNTIRIALAYPSTYQVAMSSLSVHLLYSYLNQFDDVYVERVVLEGEGPYRSIETGTLLRDFDLILFSVHYELDYVNLVKMLVESGVSPHRQERAQKRQPVVIVGGPCISANPEPLADIADIIVIGEAEPILDVLTEYLSSIVDRRFEDLPVGEGVYVPQLGKHEVKRAYVEYLDDTFYPIKQIVTLEAPERFMPVFGKAFFLEVVRGCPFMCYFCMESYVQFPFRFRTLSKLVDIVDEGLKHCPVDKIVLIGLGTQSHPDLKKLVEYVHENYPEVQVSFPSLRVDVLDDEMLELLVKSRQDVLTIAPESSTRIREAVGKKFDNSKVIELAYRAKKLGVDHLKLYFIVGLPGEKREDLDECAELVRKIAHDVKCEVYISVNPWIRKPSTPLQFAPPLTLEEVESRIRYFESKLGVRLTVYDPVLAYAQMLLALSDRAISKLIIELGKLSKNPLARSTWKSVFERFPELLRNYVYRRYTATHEMPWSHVIQPLSVKTLLRKFEQYASTLGLSL